jgi:hypothetical protein
MLHKIRWMDKRDKRDKARGKRWKEFRFSLVNLNHNVVFCFFTVFLIRRFKLV